MRPTVCRKCKRAVKWSRHFQVWFHTTVFIEKSHQDDYIEVEQ